MTKKCKCPIGQCAGHMEVSAKLWRGLERLTYHQRGLATRRRVVRRGKVMVWLDYPFSKVRRREVSKSNQE